MYRKKSSETTAGGDYKSKGQKAIDKFTEMMISRMESMKADEWRKGWIDGTVYGMPQNISEGTIRDPTPFSCRWTLP